MGMRWAGLEERQRQAAALLAGERGTRTMTQYMKDLKRSDTSVGRWFRQDGGEFDGMERMVRSRLLEGPSEQV
eukprot:15365303-Ditylum_brightwellii.AAC.2